MVFHVAIQRHAAGLNFAFTTDHSQHATSINPTFHHHCKSVVRFRKALPQKRYAILSVIGGNGNKEQSDINASFLQGVKELDMKLRSMKERASSSQNVSTSFSRSQISRVSVTSPMEKLKDSKEVTSLMGNTLKDSTEFQDLLKWMRRAFAAYRIEDNLNLIDLGFGNKTENILEFESNNELRKPMFYILEEPASNQFTLGIRGTFSFSDAVTDAQAWSYSFQNGHAHQGFIEASDYVLEHEKFKPVLAKLKDNKDYHLHITGHSYGAAVSSLATVALLKDGKYSEYKLDGRVHGWGYACPPCLDMDLSRDPSTARSVTNVVNEVDFVTMMTLRGFIEFLAALALEVNKMKYTKTSLQVRGEVPRKVKLKAEVLTDENEYFNGDKEIEEVQKQVNRMLEEIHSSKVWTQYMESRTLQDVPRLNYEDNISQSSVDSLLELSQILKDNQQVLGIGLYQQPGTTSKSLRGWNFFGWGWNVVKGFWTSLSNLFGYLLSGGQLLAKLYIPGTMVILSQDEAEIRGEDVNYWIKKLKGSESPRMAHVARKGALQTYERNGISIFEHGDNAYSKKIIEAMFRRYDL